MPINPKLELHIYLLAFSPRQAVMVLADFFLTSTTIEKSVHGSRFNKFTCIVDSSEATQLTHYQDVTQFNSLRCKNPSIWFTKITQHRMAVGQSVADGKINPNIVGQTDSADMVVWSFRSDE